jgi:hypothetical protein
LNIPPVTRKNTHTDTAREDPKAAAMYRRLNGSSGVSGFRGSFVSIAVCAPTNERNRNMKVPQNSPKRVTTMWRVHEGKLPNGASGGTLKLIILKCVVESDLMRMIAGCHNHASVGHM